jgi:serine/threonine protein kinase
MSSAAIFCSHCGASNPPGELFCDSCGYALAAPATSALTAHTLTGQLPAHTLLRQRYLILQVVGQGGMGAVYLAQDTALGDRLVAVKEMSQQNSQQAQEAIDNFKREAHLLASLQHPNLPSIYDHFEENGRWYLVMSFIQGETLEDYLSHLPEQRLPLEETLHIGQELCNVLHYLHTHQPPIIFRDLKPGNIMRSTDGHIYLIDFGIARHFKPGKAKDTANYGSAGYAPPEQYGKAQTTERSDIYSLGATLYQLLSGHDPSLSPFRFPPLQSLVPTLPEQLVRLITQMLEMDESKRPASIQEVQQELQMATLSSITGQYAPVFNVPKRPTPALSALRQATAPHPALPARVQMQQVQTHLQPAAQVSLPPAQQLPAQQPPVVQSSSSVEEILSIIAMLAGIACAVIGMIGLFFTLQAHHSTLSSIAFGELFLSLGSLALVSARVKSVSTSRARKIEIAVELLAGLIITIFAIITIVVTYSVFAQGLNFLYAGGITAESMLSAIVGIAICLLTLNRIKRTP